MKHDLSMRPFFTESASRKTSGTNRCRDPRCRHRCRCRRAASRFRRPHDAVGAVDPPNRVDARAAEHEVRLVRVVERPGPGEDAVQRERGAGGGLRGRWRQCLQSPVRPCSPEQRPTPSARRRGTRRAERVGESPLEPVARPSSARRFLRGGDGAAPPPASATIVRANASSAAWSGCCSQRRAAPARGIENQNEPITSSARGRCRRRSRSRPLEEEPPVLLPITR